MFVAVKTHPQRDLSGAEWAEWYATREAALPTQGIWEHAHVWELTRIADGKELGDWVCELCLQHEVVRY